MQYMCNFWNFGKLAKLGLKQSVKAHGPLVLKCYHIAVSEDGSPGIIGLLWKDQKNFSGPESLHVSYII